MSWGYRPWRPSSIGYFRVPFIVTDIFIYCITITYTLLMFVGTQMKLLILWFVPWTSWRMCMSCCFYVSSICQRFVLVYLVGPAAHTRFMVYHSYYMSYVMRVPPVATFKHTICQGTIHSTIYERNGTVDTHCTRDAHNGHRHHQAILLFTGFYYSVSSPILLFTGFWH